MLFSQVQTHHVAYLVGALHLPRTYLLLYYVPSGLVLLQHAVASHRIADKT